MEDMIANQNGRKLGYFEAATANPGCVVVMVAHLSGDRLQIVALQKAVAATTRRHPILRTKLVSSGTEFSLKPTPPPYCVPAVHVVVDSEWERVVQEECNSGFCFMDDSPLWKIVLVQGEPRDVLLVKFHHCIADASSGYILINDLLTFHCQSIENNDFDEESVISLPDFTCPDELCLPLVDEGCIQTALDNLRERRESWVPVLPFEPNPPPGNQHNVIFRDGSPLQLQRLQSRCRERGVSVGSVLVAATYFAVAKLTYDSDEDFSFDFDMDVNLRDRFPGAPGSDHVGAFIGMMAFNLTVTPTTTFWGLVETARRAIGEGLEEKQHLSYFEVGKRLDALGSIPGSSKEDTHGHAQDMNFSNVGKYLFPTTVGSVTVEKIYCVGGGWCPTFGSYIFLIPSVKELNFSLVYEAADFNDKIANDFLDLVVSLTENAPNVSESFVLADYIAEPLA